MAFPDSVAPCPALGFDGDISECGLVVAEKHFFGGDMVQKSLGIGTGCSMPDENTTEEEIETADKLAYIKMYGQEAPHE